MPIVGEQKHKQKIWI